MSNEVVVQETGEIVAPSRVDDNLPMTVNAVKKQVNLIQHIMKELMIEDVHFGRIPGCGPKPALLKAGAEKLTMTFRMAPSFEITKTDLPDGHREYEIVTTLKDMTTGRTLGQGVGCCSTMEGKYRYRSQNTGQEVPKEYWKARDSALLGGSQYSTKKTGSGQYYTSGKYSGQEIKKWFIVEKILHDNPADYYNTVLKIAKKRSLVDADLTVTAASDIFAQDIDDNPELFDDSPPNPPTPKAKDSKWKTDIKPPEIKTPPPKNNVTFEEPPADAPPEEQEAQDYEKIVEEGLNDQAETETTLFRIEVTGKVGHDLQPQLQSVGFEWTKCLEDAGRKCQRIKNLTRVQADDIIDRIKGFKNDEGKKPWVVVYDQETGGKLENPF